MTSMVITSGGHSLRQGKTRSMLEQGLILRNQQKDHGGR
jgi:hypothetical protein